MRFGFKEFRKSPRSDSTEFRKRFPADITAAAGKSHFTCSVGVIGERQASAAYAKAFSRYQEKCEQLRREIAETAVLLTLHEADSPPKRNPTQIIVDPAAVEEAIERWRVAEIGRSYMEVANGLIDIDPLGMEAMRRSDLCATLKEYQGYRRITDFDDRMLAALASQGIDVPGEHPALRMFRHSFAAAWLDAENYKDRMIRNPTSVEPPPSPAPPSARPAMPVQGSVPLQPTTTSLTLTDLAEEWLKRDKKPAKTQSKVRRCVKMLTAHLGGDVPVESITPMQLTTFYEDAVKLPARPRQYEIAMSFHELIAQNIPEGRRITIQTVANWMNLLHSACNWGRKKRLITLNPIADNKPNAEDAKPKYPTLIPNDEEITKLFNSEIYTERRKSPAWFWLPLLAVYTGARLNELGQLERSDVIWDEIPYLHITTDTAEDNDEDAPPRRAKTLKTKNSKRRVPIHPKLLELGFRGYFLSSKSFHLFPDLPHHNLRDNDTPTQNFSRDFGRYLRKLKARRGVKFHSFRHLFTDLSEDMGVNPRVRSILVGHASENDLSLLLGAQMTDRYGSGYGRRSRIQFMLEEISKVQYSAMPAIEPWT